VTVQNLRDFLRILFRSTATRLREERIADLEQQRDYFKGRAERLELMMMRPGLLSTPSRPEPDAQTFRPSRPSLAQLQQELTERETQQEKEN